MGAVVGAAEGGRMTTRKTLVENMQDIETVLLDLEGVTPRPDISDKDAMLVAFRSLWCIHEYLIRRAKDE